MNLLNYANLEASRRLVEAGIVLETDCFWYLMSGQWVLSTWRHPGSYSERIPAPCMAEVLREFDKYSAQEFAEIVRKRFSPMNEKGLIFYLCHVLRNIDGAVDLLIWVTAQKKGGGDEAIRNVSG